MDGTWLIIIALVIEYIVRIEARILDEGGFYEDRVIGYDFSEGYAHLEGNTAKVRPYRKSTLKALEKTGPPICVAGADRRKKPPSTNDFDEILDKIHREGRRQFVDRRGKSVHGPREQQVSQSPQSP